MSDKLALSHEILMQVEKPARYIGNEINMAVKDPDAVDIRFCMCFPDVYEIGMSHLGIQILYEMFNRREDTYCERVYSPWPDLHKIMKEQNIPLFALETQDAIKDFDFLGITIQYEMCYTNIIQILDLAQIGIFSKDRAEDAPIVIGGGPCVYNPEPIADFFDLIYIGEGETVYDELLDLYKKQKKAGWNRKRFLRLASQIEGIYVPSLYEIFYQEDGTIKEMRPLYEEVPKKVKKQVVEDLTNAVYPEKPLVAFLRPTQDRVTLEIQRGCIRGCRFCQAGMIYRPLRERDVAKLKEYAVTMLEATGHEEITLSSLSSSDYSALEELTYFLIDECKEKKINISLPSLRIDAFSLDVMSRVQDVKKSSLTFAPEAGSQRMRNVINKGLTEEVILNGAMEAFHGGWNKVKLYFMLGLPFETDEDVKAIPELADLIAQNYYTIPKDERNGRVKINASASFFVPKPFTPFQWAPMNTDEEFLRKAYLANDTMHQMLNHKSLSFQYHDAKTTVLEGILARGDRKLSSLLLHIYEKGGIFDAWTEWFQPKLWMDTLEEDHIDVAFYTTRDRSLEEVFPWDFIDAGVTKNFLKKEYLRAKEGVVTPNCKMKCSGCGAAIWKGGICYESKNEVC
ncbi:MAG: TIGR03960 family B12-binding radical SAM protein [Lachnospiraceae bacterium]|nr:TIGR03960 family B12-binding radical SAM protein [Lachnospiraceae bacterium]